MDGGPLPQVGRWLLTVIPYRDNPHGASTHVRLPVSAQRGRQHAAWQPNTRRPGVGQVCPAAIDAMDCSRPAHAHPPQVRDDLRAGGTTVPTQQAGIPPRMRWCRGLAAIQAASPSRTPRPDRASVLYTRRRAAAAAAATTRGNARAASAPRAEARRRPGAGAGPALRKDWVPGTVTTCGPHPF